MVLAQVWQFPITKIYEAKKASMIGKKVKNVYIE